MNVTEDLTSTEWKHFVGKNEIVREGRSSFKKNPLQYLIQNHRIHFSKQEKVSVL